MPTHKLVGPPQAELVVRVEPQPEYVAEVFGMPHGKWDYQNTVPHGWMETLLLERCPYQPGDTLEFWPRCEMCTEKAVRHSENDESDLCEQHLCPICDSATSAIIPAHRTVSRVTVRERDGWEWVIHVS